MWSTQPQWIISVSVWFVVKNDKWVELKLLIDY
jgi:hypothetical protein